MAGGLIGSVIGGIFTGGAGPAIGAGIGQAIPAAAEIARTITERLIPDPAKRAEAEAAIAAALAARDAALLQTAAAGDAAQNAINLAEAQGNDRYSSRWRPTLGWSCVAAFIYNFLLAPILTWVGAIVGVIWGFSSPVPPMMSTNEFMPVLIGMLGLGAYRTVERVSGVSVTAPPGAR